MAGMSVTGAAIMEISVKDYQNLNYHLTQLYCFWAQT